MSYSSNIPRNSSAREIDLNHWVLKTWLISTLLVFMVFVLRRFGGGFTSPLPFLPAFLVGCIITAYTYYFRQAFRYSRWADLHPLQIDHKISLATALLLLTITIPGTISLAVIVLWLPWISFELQWWCVRMEPSVSNVPLQASNTNQSPQASHRAEKYLPIMQSNEEEDLMLVMRRVRTDLNELISGTVQVEFAADQQTAVAHLVFCPPLPSDPEIMAEPCNGESVTVRVSESRSYGARLEVKRSPPLHSADQISIAFEAIAEKQS